MRKIYPILVCLLTSSCSVTKGLQLAGDASTIFHSRMDAAQFEDIFRDSAGGPTNPQTMHHDFIAMITRVHDKMGTCGVAKMTNYQLVGNTAGTMCYLSYVRHCENGDLSEDFQLADHGREGSTPSIRTKERFLTEVQTEPLTRYFAPGVQFSITFICSIESPPPRSVSRNR